MSAVETLEAVAKLLPADRRERFLGMAARFRSVPEDDEYLQILEAIGLMTLLWREVPQEIQQVLEKANPVTETCQGVAGKVRDAVLEAIPSYEDLRKITQRLEAHELALKNTLATPVKTEHMPWFWIPAIFVLGVIAGLIACKLLTPLLP